MLRNCFQGVFETFINNVMLHVMHNWMSDFVQQEEREKDDRVNDVKKDFSVSPSNSDLFINNYYLYLIKLSYQ